MHIVFISREFGDSKRGGGIASYLYDTSSALLVLGHKVTIITASDDTRKYSVKKNGLLTIIRLDGGDFIIPSVESTLGGLRKFRIFYRFFSYRMRVMKELLKLEKVDIAEVSEFGAESIFFNRMGFPVVIRLQTSSLLDRNTGAIFKFSLKLIPNFFTGYFEKRVLNYAEYITACSQSLKDWTVEYFGVTKSKVKVIYNPLHLNNWKFDRNENSLEGLSIIYAGTVSVAKGVGDLIQACKILRSNGLEPKLQILGKMGDYGTSLKQANTNEPWIQFLGHVTKVEMLNLYQASAIAIFPSHWEAMGIVCVEAMLSGALVIGSAQGGMAEIIEEGVDGFLIEPKSPQILSETIEMVYRLPLAQKIQISENAKQKVSKDFNSQNIVPELVDYFESTIVDFKG